MNDGQVDKLFYVFGSKSREIVDQFEKCKKNRFYLDPKLVGDCCCDFILIDACEIKGDNFNQWIEGLALIDSPIIIIVDENQYLTDDSIINYTLNSKFNNLDVFRIKNHEQLKSVLEAVSELQNGFSVPCIDFADFISFLKKGQYYWSDTVYSQSIDKLNLKIVENLENVKATAKNSSLKVTGVFGCMKGQIYSNVVDDFGLICDTLREFEPLFDCDSFKFMTHSNLLEKTDVHEKSELGFHMLWSLSDL